jgi:hypothetical protein
MTQVSFWQICPNPQAIPQPPQLLGSLSSRTQEVPPQHDADPPWSVTQSLPTAPATQLVGAQAKNVP